MMELRLGTQIYALLPFALYQSPQNRHIKFVLAFFLAVKL
jgi:hypothetical protein